MSAIAETTPKKKPAEDEYRFLLLWEMTVDQTGTENLFQPLKQTGSFDVILAFESCTCESVRFPR